MADISPPLRKDIEELAQVLRANFSPPQFIPGCLVKDVADVSLYATNNGWIEAICGQHNQQRVRWKSAETVAANDFVDVLYFPGRRVFEAYGMGGAGAIASSAGWPFAKVLTVSATDPDADYTTLPAAAAAASAGDVILLDAGEYILTTALSYGAAFTIQGIDPKTTIISSSTNSITILNPDTAGAALRNVTVNHTGAGTTAVGVSFGANDIVIENVIINLAGASSLGMALRQYGGTSGCKVINCFVTASGASTAQAFANEVATANCEIYGGKFSGTTADIYGDQAGSTLTLNNVALANDLVSYAGLILGTHRGVAAYHNAAQSINNATDTSLALNSERRDDSGFHDTATNNSRLTVPAGMAGWYQMSGNVGYASNAAGVRQTSILLNGTTYIVVNLQQAVNGAPTLVGVGALYYLNAGDYIELRAYQTSGGALNVDSLANYSPELRMVRVR